MKKVFLFFLILFFSQQTYGQDFDVIDGDTILLDGEEVHLLHIEAPEIEQPYGIDAQINLAALISSGEWRIKSLTNRGPNGRYVTFTNKDGKLLTEYLVESGVAWAVDPKKMIPSRLQKLMAKAKQNSVGLWSLKKQIPPSEWRKNPTRYTANFAMMAENQYRSKLAKEAEKARRQEAWDTLVATNPELANKIILNNKEKERHEELLRKLNSIKRSQRRMAYDQRSIKRGLNIWW